MTTHLWPVEETEEFEVIPGRTLRIGSRLPIAEKEALKDCLMHNVDVFAWSTEEMPVLPRKVAEHHLRVEDRFRPIHQKK